MEVLLSFSPFLAFAAASALLDPASASLAAALVSAGLVARNA
jgi:hypothetical protein